MSENQFRERTKKMRLIDAKEGKKRFCEIAKPAEYNGVIHLVVPISEIDKLPTVDAVELPCKIGDRVWAIRSYKGHKHPQDGIVSEMYFLNDMRLQIVVKHVARGEWGKTVFATREDAVAAILKGR